jgi:hypothetical protein
MILRGGGERFTSAGLPEHLQILRRPPGEAKKLWEPPAGQVTGNRVNQRHTKNEKMSVLCVVALGKEAVGAPGCGQVTQGVDSWSEGVYSCSEGEDLWSEAVDLWSEGVDCWGLPENLQILRSGDKRGRFMVGGGGFMVRGPARAPADPAPPPTGAQEAVGAPGRSGKPSQYHEH